MRNGCNRWIVLGVLVAVALGAGAVYLLLARAPSRPWEPVQDPVVVSPAPEAPSMPVTQTNAVTEYSTGAEYSFFCLFMDGQKIGHAVHTRTEQDQQVITEETIHLTVRRIGVPVTLDVTEKSIETSDGRPLGFEMDQQLSMMAMHITGIVREDGTVETVTGSMGSEQKAEQTWPAGAVMAEGLRLLSVSKGLVKGTSYTAKVYSPSLMQAVDMTMEVGARQSVDLLGRTVSLVEVTSSYLAPGVGQVKTHSFVDDRLEPKKAVIPIAGMQIEMVACAKDVATSEADPVEMVAKTLIPCPVRLPDLGTTPSVTYTLSPKDGADLLIPSTDSQTVEKRSDGMCLVTVRPVKAPEGQSFPYKGENQAVLGALKANVFLQVDDPQIQDLAKKAVGGTNDAAEAVKAIEAFVAEYILNKDMAVGYASAKEVAASRQGDCTEHAVLCAALCRAAGIPAQVVVGIAYVDQFGGHVQCFGGHAWTQAYVGDRWVGLDAAFKGTGRGGFDAGHITLAVGNGEPGDFFGLLGTLGRFSISQVLVGNP